MTIFITDLALPYFLDPLSSIFILLLLTFFLFLSFTPPLYYPFLIFSISNKNHFVLVIALTALPLVILLNTISIFAMSMAI